jgi:hypothetical protein
MPTLHVFLYENGAKGSFAGLSGKEIEAIADEVVEYGDLDAGGDEEYAVIDVSDAHAQTLSGTKIKITPRQLGISPWANVVELEFRSAEDMDVDGGRKKRKTRKGGRKTRKGKKASKKSRKTRGRK